MDWIDFSFVFTNAFQHKVNNKMLPRPNDMIPGSYQTSGLIDLALTYKCQLSKYNKSDNN